MDILPLFLEEIEQMKDLNLSGALSRVCATLSLLSILLQLFPAALQQVCVNSKAKEKHLDGNFKLFDAMAWHAFSGF